MNQCNINLLDLPSEILVIILKKLDNMDVLYSLFGLNNQRLDNIIQENTSTNTLNFVLTTLTDDILSISHPILDRFCMNILPRIHCNVKSLIVNSLSMECILFAGDYPNLSELKIFNFNVKIASRYFTVVSPFRGIFQRQITDLILVFENNFNELSCTHYMTYIYGYILKFFENLNHLSIIGSYPKFFPPLVLCDLPLTTCYSSTLYKLCIHVMYYHDLLALLDGRLKQLNTLNVVIAQQEHYPRNVYNMNLPNLKCFSLQYKCYYTAYDGEILPLLRRMSNIEVLNLNLIIDDPAPFIDGKKIYNEIIVHMSQLHTFNFCFVIYTRLNHSIGHLSKDDILQTFANIIQEQVECIIKYRGFGHVKYHLFSLPFMFDDLQSIGNTFPNIIFNHVIRLAVNDDIPFEYEFFMRIARCFPLLKVLTVQNSTPQSPILNSNDNQLYSTIIEYPYLTSLYLLSVHRDYVDQFLNDKKTHLPRLTVLSVKYNDLRNVTRNFTNDRTRMNCMKVKQLHLGPKKIVHSEDFYAYFPLL